MIRHSFPLLLGLLARFASPVAAADVPGGIEIICEANRNEFRSAAQGQSSVTFRLWDAETGGSQVGPDYIVPMAELVVEKVKADSKYDNVKRRPYGRIEATIGSDATPVDLGTGEVWLDVRVGTTTLTCDEGKRVAVPPIAPPSRRRLQGVAFARGSPVSVRVEINSLHVIQDSTLTALSWDSERWDVGCPGAGLFDIATPSRLTACGTGKYHVFSNITWNNSASGYRFAGLRVNGAGQLIASQQTQGDAIANSDSSIGTVIDLVAGDYVEVVVFQNIGGPLEVSPASAPPANTSPGFGMAKLQ
jgi:hypothetical protein